MENDESDMKGLANNKMSDIMKTKVEKFKNLLKYEKALNALVRSIK